MSCQSKENIMTGWYKHLRDLAKYLAILLLTLNTFKQSVEKNAHIIQVCMDRFNHQDVSIEEIKVCFTTEYIRLKIIRKYYSWYRISTIILPTIGRYLHKIRL